MNITFLIGNGFDLNLNLNTSYAGFYNYLNEKYPAKSKGLSAMESRIIESIEDDKEKPIEEKLWSDFEIGLGLFTSKITAEEVEEFNDARLKLKEKLAEFLDLSKSKLKLLDHDPFMTVFKQSINRFPDEFSAKDSKVIFEKLHSSSELTYNFITFNYTDSLETIIKYATNKTEIVGEHMYNSARYFHRIGEIVHIHGTSTDRMILGVNDASQIANEELQANEDLIHTFVKPQINADCGALVDENAMILLTQSKFLVVFGMSYGATDKDWWKAICQLMLNDGSKQLLLFERNQKCNQIHMENEYKLKNEVINKFFDGLELTDKQKTALKPRIRIAFNSQLMFKLAEPVVDEEQQSTQEEPVTV